MSKEQFKNNCSLCKREKISTNWFYIVECKTCCVPMIVSTEHKPKFSQKEKEDIKKLFGNTYNTRWQQRQIKDHAHCHLIKK